MAPLLTLCTTFLLLRGLGWIGVPMLDHWHPALQGGVACMFLLTASAHWGKRRPDLVLMVPPGLPYKEGIVTWTGVLEIAGAIGILIPGTACIGFQRFALNAPVDVPGKCICGSKKNVHTRKARMAVLAPFNAPIDLHRGCYISFPLFLEGA